MKKKVWKQLKITEPEYKLLKRLAKKNKWTISDTVAELLATYNQVDK